MMINESQSVLATSTGPMVTYLYHPTTNAKRTSVVLFSEIFQQTGPIKRMAAMLAGHGYGVAVPEIFHELEAPGAVLAYDQAGADKGNTNKLAKAIGAYDADAKAVIDHLLERDDSNGKVVAMGVCIGGHLAFRCALDSRVRAAACFYATDLHKGSLGSGGDDSLLRAAEVKGELMMVWGKQDPHIPLEGRTKIHARLLECSANFTWHEYNAQHAFMRDEGPRYDPALALLSYRMVLDLFSRV